MSILCTKPFNTYYYCTEDETPNPWHGLEGTLHSPAFLQPLSLVQCTLLSVWNTLPQVFFFVSSLKPQVKCQFLTPTPNPLYVLILTRTFPYIIKYSLWLNICLIINSSSVFPPDPESLGGRDHVCTITVVVVVIPSSISQCLAHIRNSAC